MKLKQAYDDHSRESIATGLTCKDKSLTQQQFKDEVDINFIAERFHLTGEMPQLTRLPEFQDYEGVFDFQSAMNTIRAAQEQFMQLPAAIRAEHDNDPQKFLAWCGDERNRDKAAELGLLAPEALQRLQEGKKRDQEDLEEGRKARVAKTTPPAPPNDTKVSKN